MSKSLLVKLSNAINETLRITHSSQSETKCVFVIVTVSHVFQISHGVVGFVAVNMIDFLSVGARTNKCFGYKAMNIVVDDSSSNAELIR